jgi:REP element-mobilizing transposase RayT
MAKARKMQVSLEATPYYHCISRCVRRSFLCGVDSYSGQSYAHRRQWVEARLYKLVGVFAIDLCAFSVMSNHTHTVLRVDRQKALEWDRAQVIDRWHSLYAGNWLYQKFKSGSNLSEVENTLLDGFVSTWRERLYDISWFMRNLNEYIAREANREDKCTGRFWEGRFKSQALLDDKALISCMAYVDLNPIRAKMADTPEASDHTSIQLRIKHARQSHSLAQPKQLLPFLGNPRKDIPDGLQFELEDYLNLVDWTGRIMRSDKRGAIDNNLPPILQRLGIAEKQWTQLTQDFEQQFHQFVGDADCVKEVTLALGYQRAKGLGRCRALFTT